MATYEVYSPKRQATYTIEAPDGTQEATLKAFATHQDMQWNKQQNDPNYMGTKQEDFIAGKNPYKKTNDTVSAWDTFTYGVDAGEIDFGNWANVLEAKFPSLFEISLTPEYVKKYGFIRTMDEKYGEGFSDLTEQQRLDRIQEVKLKQRQEEYPEIFAAGLQDSGWSKFGQAVGSLFSPTTLVPISTKKYSSLFGMSALLGAEYTYLHERARTTDVDPTKVAAGAAIAGVGGTALVGGARFLNKNATKFVQNVRAKSSGATPEEIAQARIDIAKVQKELDTAQAKPIYKTIGGDTTGATRRLTDEEVGQRVLQRLGMTVEDVAVAERRSGVRLTKLTEVEKAVSGVIPPEGVDGVASQRGFFRDLLGSMSSAIGRIHAPTKLRLRQMELNSSQKVQEYNQRVEPFMKFVGSLGGQQGRDLKYFLLNRQFAEARELITTVAGRNAPKAIEDFNETIKVYDELHQELVSAGYKNLPKLGDYWSRSIKDMDKLKASIGSNDISRYQLALKRYKAQLVSKGALTSKDDPLTEIQEQDFMMEFLRGKRGKVINEKKLSAAEKRKIKTIKEEQLDFYDSPQEALGKYIQNTVYDIERKRFFGGKAVETGDGRLDIDQSISGILNLARNNGQVNDASLSDLKALLSTRFVEGDQATHKFWQGMRGMGYMSTLTNPFSALIQLGDIGVSVYVNGMGHTIAGLLTKNKISMQELGLDKIIAQEFVTDTMMAKSLHKAFTWSGFRAVDRLGKNTLLNASLRSGSKTAQRMQKGKKLNSKGRAFADKYQEAFGKHYDSLVDDLANGRMTENVKLYLWSELSDVQPISLSEMPIKYLQNPGGRIFYTLKTYMAKQVDLMQRDIGDKWNKGGKQNRYDATRNAIAYSLIVPTINGGVGMLRDKAQGREVTVDDFLDRAVNEYFRLFGSSEYHLNHLSKTGDVKDFAVNTLAPPLDYATDAFSYLIDTALDRPDAEIDEVLKHVPVVGKFYYTWLTPTGLDKYVEYQQKKEDAEFSSESILEQLSR